MQHEAMVTTLRTLKLFGMAQAVSELAQQGAPAYQGAQAILGSLLKAEMAEREVRSVAYQMKAARFPAYRDLAGFDFGQSAANEALVRQLHTVTSWNRPTTWCWWVAPALARPTSPPPSACRHSSSIAGGCASFPPSNW